MLITNFIIRSTNPLSRNYPTLCFLIEKRRSEDAQVLLTNVIIRSTEAAVHRCSGNKVFLEILQHSKNTSVFESRFNKISGLKVYNFIKK